VPRRIALLVALVAMGCSSGTHTPGPTDGASLHFDSKATITVDDNGITPNLTTVRTDEAISVTNAGTKDHGLASDSIDTGTLRPGESTVVYVTSPDTIDVHDRAEPTHTARIEVTPA
jgi:hypothetical protein